MSQFDPSTFVSYNVAKFGGLGNAPALQDHIRKKLRSAKSYDEGIFYKLVSLAISRMSDAELQKLGLGQIDLNPEGKDKFARMLAYKIANKVW